MALDQTGLPNERKLAFIDRNHDLHLTNVRKFGGGLVPGKLGVMVASMLWAADCPMLAAMQETKFTLWYFPAILWVDRSLVGRTLVERDTGEFGKHPVIVSFLRNSLSVRRADGSLVTTGVSPYPAILHGYAASGHWEEATKLCRSARVPFKVTGCVRYRVVSVAVAVMATISRVKPYILHFIYY